MEFLRDPVNLVNLIFWIFYGAIIARIILSLLVPTIGPRPNAFLMALYTVATQLSEPILGPIRRVLPNFGFLDLSPMVAIILLEIIRYVLLSVILSA
ncbi:MAG: YggT family protein [SAR202 cluster bacterium]|nr:YggT family protein [SAR202 cluster bacterium]